MKKLIIILLLMCSNAYGAEFLVKKNPSWAESVDRSSWTASKLEKYERRKRVGDIVVVKPDGWKWGTEEIKNYYILKVPSISYDKAKKYEEQLTEQVYIPEIDGYTTRVIKRRKHGLHPAALSLFSDTLKERTVTGGGFRASILEKTE